MSTSQAEMSTPPPPQLLITTFTYSTVCDSLKDYLRSTPPSQWTLAGFNTHANIELNQLVGEGTRSKRSEYGNAIANVLRPISTSKDSEFASDEASVNANLVMKSYHKWKLSLKIATTAVLQESGGAAEQEGNRASDADADAQPPYSWDLTSDSGSYPSTHIFSRTPTPEPPYRFTARETLQALVTDGFVKPPAIIGPMINLHNSDTYTILDRGSLRLFMNSHHLHQDTEDFKNAIKPIQSFLDRKCSRIPAFDGFSGSREHLIQSWVFSTVISHIPQNWILDLNMSTPLGVRLVWEFVLKRLSFESIKLQEYSYNTFSGFIISSFKVFRGFVQFGECDENMVLVQARILESLTTKCSAQKNCRRFFAYSISIDKYKITFSQFRMLTKHNVPLGFTFPYEVFSLSRDSLTTILSYVDRFANFMASPPGD